MTENIVFINQKDVFATYKAFQDFYPKKHIPEGFYFQKNLNNVENLSNLAMHMLDELATTSDHYAYYPIIIELVARLVNDLCLEREYIKKGDRSVMIEGSLVLSTIAKIATSTPEIVNLVELYLQTKSIFHSLSNCITTIPQEELQSILLAFHRLLFIDRAKFHKFVIPDVLNFIIASEASTDINKYLSILILSNYLFLAEDVRNNTIAATVDSSNLTGTLDGEPNVNFKFLNLIEVQRLSNLSKIPPTSTARNPQSQSNISINQNDLSLGVSIIAGVLVPNILSSKNSDHNMVDEASQSSFVPIEKSFNALKTFANHLKTSDPVMLIGKAGSGKTFMVNEIAKILGIDESNSLIKIHLNQQTDSKTLLGTYTSGTKPGTFEWKSGVLTTAVREGKWVLVEDIDKAPNEVLSILMGLLENRQLTIPSRGEVISAANGFQLISTVRTQNKDVNIPDIIGMRLWKVLYLEELEASDIKVILNKKFPLLARFTSLFINFYFAVKAIYDSRRFISMNKGAQPRQISIRDLMKFCNRCDCIISDAGVTSLDDMIQDETYDSIFNEAIDCFTSAVVEKEPIEALIREIGGSLEIPSSRINLQLTKSIPVFEDHEDAIRIGRVSIKKQQIIGMNKSNRQVATGNITSFAKTNHSLKLMERIGAGISMCEPLLLVGETGTGKTTVVQQMAKLLNKKLNVINVSQQTEVGDLLGGFKPINAKTLALPLQQDFEYLFARSFSAKNNAQFINLLSKCFNKSQWKNVSRLWKEAYKMADKTLKKEKPDTDKEESSDDQRKKRKLNQSEKSQLMKEWEILNKRVSDFEKQSIDIENSFVFKFVEGSLVKAIKNGDWLLLDEMNLATPETLDSISDLLAEDSSQRSILLSEKGDVESIKAHPNFRIFGCMNPATDVGKKDLPQSIRSRFTEIYVQSPDEDITDLLMIIDKYVGKYSLSDEWVGNDISELYLTAKQLSNENRIVDGANQKPHFSIRTLTRTLLYVKEIVSIYGLRRSLFEGFCMSFLTLLDAKSEELLKPLIEKYTVGKLKNSKSVMNQIPRNPSNSTRKYVQFKHYWIEQGSQDPEPQPHYIITPFVEKNMLNLVRAASGGRFPVLIQGPTSAGKTSMIKYLARITGHEFVRINNHEHTDLQEYLGTYVSDDSGKLVFKEGILVDALRKGHWIVLDELNLAPTDVLEALNRLLDDNRELFIPETQEVVTPHPDFMLFATQNPPGLYGGRKVLSKAFRNRFLELHFDDIPQDELETILRERCQIAPSYAKKIVEVYKELSVQRQSTRVFEQKNSFATLRDLFRWATRDAVGYEQLAANGYMLLAERVRRPEEKAVVKQALEKTMKVKLEVDQYYKQLEIPALLEMKGPVVWTKAMRRLAVLVMTAMKNNEPLLLVGETGCGKTTVCQMIADFFGKDIIIVNAHQNTETGDLLGAQRPIRNRSQLQQSLTSAITTILAKDNIVVPDSVTTTEALALWKQHQKSNPSSREDSNHIEHLKKECNALFEWNDGPLVNALKNGSYFLLDEISLADDSVLERLNSVLEPERTLFLAEKGADDALITAMNGFQFLATMNPGGDYGKKELSPALRNRFTEIWVPSMEDFDDVRQIVTSKLNEGTKQLADVVVAFSEWYGKRMGAGDATNGIISLRDILAWVNFINSAFSNGVDAASALLHGACMVFIDALGTHATAHLAENELKLREMKLNFVMQLSKFANTDLSHSFTERFQFSVNADSVSCGPFNIGRNSGTPAVTSFNLQAPTTAANAMRVIRAMQVHKPVLLEGSPGVGKTSLINALAQATGNPLTRINLSEQTDLIDLFGSDTPVEGGKAGEFAWKDAPFLRAMQKGEWVLLDEMNLASQSVLEGLNACLDHRGEAYIPELDRVFVSHPNFKVFAAQNPQYQGGGRKGLPKSFINRFSVVYVDMLNAVDLNLIVEHLYPNVDHTLSNKLIEFMSRLEEEVVVRKLWGSMGDPWEFNLRDTLRWLSLIDSPSINNEQWADDFFNLVIKQRFRTEKDTIRATELFQSIFGQLHKKDPIFLSNSKNIQCQNEIILRNKLIQYKSNHQISQLQCNVPILETIFRCINKAYPMILVGPSGAGKSELIKFAADMVGSKVYEFSMNSDIDSMDILGGYEQADITRSLSEMSLKIQEFLLEFSSVNLTLDTINFDVLDFAMKLIKSIKDDNVHAENISTIIGALETLNTAVDNSNLKTYIDQLKSLKEDLNRDLADVSFKWFDGLLVQAVEKGHWLILDNANLCSPSVLDRLNSLLEKESVLIINECTNADGSPRIIKPHSNFRLFITSDPKYGELSRAMRNRAVEVFVAPLEQRATSVDRMILSLPPCANEVEDLINDLTLAPSMKYLSSFVPSTDSTLHSLALFIDFYNLAVQSKIDFPAYNIVGFASLRFFSIIGDLTVSGERISELSNTLLLTEINKTFQFFKNIGIVEKLTQMYQNFEAHSPLLSFLEAINFKNQHALPLLNSALLPLAKVEHSQIETQETNYFFYVASMIADASSFLDHLRANSKTMKITSMNILEQSAALYAGREIKKLPKLDIYMLLVQLFTFMKGALVESLSVALLNVPRYYESLFDLLIIWQNIVSSSTKFNETAIRIYHGQILEWIDNHNIYPATLMEKLVSHVETFSRQLKLSRGSAMTLIWNASRARYPQSELGWRNYEALVDLAVRFDDVASKQFPENNNNINNFRALFLSLFDECLEKHQSVDFMTVLEDLKTKVDELMSVSSGFLGQRTYQFVNLFDSLINFVESDATANGIAYDLDNENLTLALLAKRSTLSLTSHNNTELFKPYPKILNSLWTEGGDLKLPLFDDSFLKEVLVSDSNIPSTEGGKLDETVFDLKFLIEQTLKKSPQALADHLQHFSNIVLKWILFICDLHVQSLQIDCEKSRSLLTSLEKHSLKEHCEIHKANGQHAYSAIFETYFMPALALLGEQKSKSTIGKAFVLAASGMIMLYMPDSTYDPAAVDHILYDDFKQLQKTIDSIRKSFICTRTIYFGDEEIIADTLLPTIDETSIPEKPRVYRDKEPLNNLFDEWYAFFTSYIDEKHISTLMSTACKISAKSSLQINNFNRSASQFVLRLRDGYNRYSDLNDILTGFIQSMRLGLILLHNGSMESNAQVPSSLWVANLPLLSTTSEVEGLLNDVKAICKDKDLYDTDVETIYNFILQISAFQGFSDRKLTKDDYFNDALFALYYRWSFRILKEKEKESTESGVFKFSDPTLDAEKDFQRLFPDADELINVSSMEDTSSKVDMEDFYYTVAKSYLANFESKKDVNDFEFIIKSSRAAFKAADNVFDSAMPGFNKGSVYSVAFNMLKGTYHAFTEAISSNDIDFYNGSSAYETKKAGSVVKRIQFSVFELLKQWPEHATLSDLFRICQEFLEYPSTTPIFRLLSKIEQIFTCIAEWEKYAHSGVSLNQHYNSISSLIVSWRKLELASWKQVFVNEEKRIERSIGKWWFHLFEAIIIPTINGEEDDEDFEIRIVSTLNVFMSQTTFGEFTHRLNLVKAFRSHVDKLNSESPFKNTLSNIIQFYEMFQPQILETIAKTKADLEKKVNEVILLASWKDINIDALRLSSRKSHHALYKIVRKYRDCLSQPIKSYIESGISANIATSVPPLCIELKDTNIEGIEQLIKLCSPIPTWKERPQRLINYARVDSNMKIYISDIEKESLPKLHDYAKDLIAEAERLRKETPKEYKKEQKKLISGLKNEKHKLLSNAIKEIKDMGVKLKMTTDVAKVITSVTSILACSKSLTNSSFENSDRFFFRLLDLLPRLRRSVSEVHEDIPSTDAQKCLAATEHLLFSLIANRHILIRSDRYSKKLGTIVNELSSFNIKSDNKFTTLANVETVQDSLQNAQTVLHWLPKFLSYSISTLNAITEFHPVKPDFSVFIKYKKLFESFSLEKSTIVGTKDVITIEKVASTYNKLIGELKVWKSQNSAIAFIADSVLEWCDLQNISFTKQNSNIESGPKDLVSFEADFRALFNTILLVIQKIHNYQTEANKIEEENEDDKWLVAKQKRTVKYFDLLYPTSVMKKLNICLQTIKSINFNENDALIASALVQHMLPIIHHYLNLVAIVQGKLRDNYVDVSRGTFELSSILYNLATKGFCQPELPADEKESDQMQDGTGLGDGEGATNNSKDVEEDDDLAEHAQQPNEEEKDRNQDEEDDDDAVDIEGDMAGDLENAPQEDQQDDNEKDDEEEQDLDEEIDDLDDSDPNAVDEKMWDEEAESNSKEKESENMPENSNENDDMQAIEDENNADDKNDNKDNNQESADDKRDESKEENVENDENAEEEEDVGEQEDEVRNNEEDKFDEQAEEGDALELPDDINLDDDSKDNEEGDEDENAGEDDGFDDPMDDDEDINTENKDVEMTKEEEEEDNEEIEVEGEPVESDDGQEEEDEDQEIPEDDQNMFDDGAETNPETNEQSDEELANVDEDNNAAEEDNKQKQEDENDVEGIDGLETGNNDDLNEEAAVQQQTGMKSEGADADVKEEDENIGGTGGGAEFQDNEDNKKDEIDDGAEEPNDSSREKASEAMKQLGDSLKEFHRRRQEIKESTDDDLVDQQAGERPDDFQHLEGDSAENETQALGAANKDQVQSIDDNMAIDDDEKDDDENPDNILSKEIPDVKEEETEDVEMADGEENNADFEGEKRSGGIGEQKRNDDDFEINGELEDDDDDDDRVVSETEEQDFDNTKFEGDVLREYEEAENLWKHADEATRELTSSLCEQLRLILEPTLSTKLRGDYKTGKRLNMKRIIPYIASQFRKDKIWMRRTKPSKRQYQIMISVDDSKSMAESKAVDIAFQSISLVSKALTQLESGQLCVMKFGNEAKVVHPFEKQFGVDSGINVFRNFDFQDTRTDVKKLVSKSLALFSEARAMGDSDLWQLQIVLSDGVCEDHETIQRLVRKAREEKVMIVFVVIDGLNNQESIMDMNQVSYVTDDSGRMKLQVDKYLDSFPFEFYVVVHNINELPEMLSLILRQYFTELAQSSC